MPISDDHKARLYRIDPSAPDAPPGADAVLVQFNPASLAYSVQNTLEKKGRDANARQHVAQTTAKLEFDLVYDNTHDGADVRRATDKIKQFLNPGDKQSNPDQAPPLVGFEWGTFRFKGIVESFRETLDFFSAEGVPLRSTLKVALAAQEPRDVFADVGQGQATLGAADTRLAAVPPRGVGDLASQGGNPQAARALGAANGLESLRTGGGLAAIAGGEVQLKAAAGFSAGASAGLGAGLSLGGGLDVSAGIAGGLALGGGVSTGLSPGASARLGAGGSLTLAPFAGLGASAAPASLRIDGAKAQRALPAAGSAAGFALGGQALAQAGRGLDAEMGPAARIRFD